MKVKFNLNSEIETELDAKGLKVLSDYYYDFVPEMYRKYPELSQQRVEDFIQTLHFRHDNIYKFAMWEFMNIFGPECHMGNWQLSWLDVYLDSKDLTSENGKAIVEETDPNYMEVGYRKWNI